jgi:hypothetical protein
MSENVGTSTSRNPKGLQGLYRDNFTLPTLPNMKLKKGCSWPIQHEIFPTSDVYNFSGWGGEKEQVEGEVGVRDSTFIAGATDRP